jgi:hypothetical protein
MKRERMVFENTPGEIFVLLGTILGAVIAGSINWINAKERIDAETSWRQAENYLEPKVEALTSLHKELHKTKVEFHLQDDHAPFGTSDEKLRELGQMMRSFQDTMSLASIYIQDDDAMEILEAYNRWLMGGIEYFRYINRNSDDDDFGMDIDPPEHIEKKWDRFEFFDAYEAAKSVLQSELADQIRDFESR